MKVFTLELNVAQRSILFGLLIVEEARLEADTELSPDSKEYVLKEIKNLIVKFEHKESIAEA